MVTFIKSDLEFILEQILIAQAGGQTGANLINVLPNVQVPFGLRTVGGEFNNLVTGQSEFGSADDTFPRLTDPVFRTAEGIGADFFGPGSPAIPSSSYTQTSGFVFDSQPRIISNLIVDQTPNNPAAAAASAGTPGGELITSPGLDGIFADDPLTLIDESADNTPVFFIPNVTPDAGLSMPFNAWMTFFGQFFDHGLDLVTKGGSGTIFIPLQPDDPLFVPGSPTNFMVLTRATNQPGPDGVLGTADDLHEHENTTSPFVDQNQTYTSHPSHQVFLRAYELLDTDATAGVSLRPFATGKLIENRDLGADGHFGGIGADADTEIGGMATWAVLKAQARDILGINLTDADFDNVPLLATDAYGNFIPGAHGFPQVVMVGNVLVEGDPTANGGLGIDLTNALRTGHQFLIDVAHNAVPVFVDDDNDPATPKVLAPDTDTDTGNAQLTDPFGNNLTYDDELLDAHYIAGDGRVNENIGLTAVHAIFHSEHNRLVDHTQTVLLDDAAKMLAAGATQAEAVAFLNQWLLSDVTSVPTDPTAIANLVWDGERLFQAAKFGTEMQYQHLVFEEFARTVQPMVDEFLAPSGYDTTIDASIVAEFAHTVYRFGHSMLTEQFDRFDPNFNKTEVGLIAAFLNPLAYVASGPTPEEATGAIVRGLTRQVGNEIDEFVTEAVRNNLLGLPLDLAAINITRGRDAGIPSLNAARKQFFDMTGDGQLKAYISWVDFAMHLKHPESLINFIAAYGTHPLITGADTLAEKRAAATVIVLGGTVVVDPDGIPGNADDVTFSAPADRLDFLNSTGDWANDSSVHTAKDLDGVTTTGLGTIDFWVGGLAEEQMPFGGLLGSSFNFVFETQLESLQNGDRFYYLSRTAGLHFGTELEQNSFAKLVMANTDVTHLPDAIFATPTWILEVDPTKQHTGLGASGREDPTGGIEINGIEITPLVIRDNPATAGDDDNYLQYTGEDHVVLGGTAGNDIIVSGDGDDTLYGDAGDDRLEGGFGNDVLLGGDGDDIIQDQGGDDNIQGGAGNDVIQAGNMSTLAIGNLILGGDGQDFVITTEDVSTTFGGLGNDFILGAKTNLPPTGNEGDDWIEMGTQDGAPGDNFAPFLADDVPGNDIFIGGGGFDEMIGEGGDDIFIGSDAQDKMDGMSGFDWMSYKNDIFGVTADLDLAIFGGVGEIGDHIALPFAASPSSILDRFAEVEGLSGTSFTDILRGDNVDAVTILNHGGATGGALTNVALINGLAELLGAADLPITGFATGNIILGGGGGDIIEGRGGDDLIDGDKWLNVRISVRANKDGTGPEIASFDSMTEMIPKMLAGTYNPGQLVAIREIKDGGFGFDTAVFSGNRADYSVVIDNNGTALDFSDDIVTVTDNIAGRDGTDRLTHIERLQFADTFDVVVPDLNAEPVGAPTINNTTPTEGDLLTVSAAGITDADNITPTNATGAITGQVAYVWQVERDPGTGVFEDIIILPGGDLAFQSANGTSFRVTPDLAGLSLRVKAIYQDANGVPEIVFSNATAPVIDVPDAPPVTPTTLTEPTVGGEGIHLAVSDLQFILDQIRVAEANAAGADLLSLVPNVRAPIGLRTVDGSFNNLVNFGGVNQSEFGAADNVFPRLTPPVFNTAEAPPPGFGPPIPTSYQQTSGLVFDSQPRTISNLVVDQTANNPAAYATAYDPGVDGQLHTADDVLKDGVHIVTSPGLDGQFGSPDDREVFLFDNVAPDAGLSAPFNAWMTFFGQFFDHGLDLVTKGGSGTVFIPLKADDPLVAGANGIFGDADDLDPGLRFMVLTRATNRPGPDGVLGTTDDIHEHENTTSPFVDQNQTYSSHPSHQVFLRGYTLNADGEPVATGRLITNRSLGDDGQFGTGDDAEIGGMATWAVVKAQARDILGINLTDANVFNVPLLATDAYGNFIKGPNGFPQVVMKGADGIAGTADDFLVEGNPAANGGLGISLANAVGTGHAFLNDIAHSADPTGGLIREEDGIIGNTPLPGHYDGDLLDAHYIAGDGRVNENIGLTTVHAIFHSEHNRLVAQTMDTVLGTGDLAFLSEWLMPGTAPATFPTLPADIAALQWNGERLFQAAKFGTEMQYQHLVFEEFARTIQPNVDAFFAPTQVYDVNLDASIVAEFAHTVYRFGHSMLTETVDRFDPDFNVVGDPNSIDPDQQQLGLIAAFLNPLAYAASGPTPEQATGAIVRGVTRTVGNEIDEFVTEALRNNLLGLPLDLPAINLARGRDAGIPSLNSVRRTIYDQTGDSQLKPYTSWADLVQHLKHPESVINFIAAYGTHAALMAADVDTLAEKRAVATALVLGGSAIINAGGIGGTEHTFTTTETDRLAFLNSTGSYASLANGVTTTGVDAIDLWIGGLAEEKMPFGGMLGSTFNFVFENQLEKLQDGDRFYYLERTAGLAFNAELEGNSFAKLIMANSDVTHLPGIVFTTPAFTLEVDPTKQYTGLGAGRDDPSNGDPLLPLVIRDNPDTPISDTNYLRYTGEDHIVLGGTAGNDIMIASVGDDTIWGDEGNDTIDGGYGNDQLRGGAGDDIITDLGGDDNIQGLDGNDVIHGGNGVNLIIGGFGQDFIVTGEDANESFGGQGNDFILGTKADEQNMGNEGDDWIEHGTSDGAPGDNFDPLGNDPIAGNDVYIGSGEMDKFNAEGGDDIMVGSPGTGDRYIGASGFDWATFKNDTLGVTIDISDRFFDQPVVPGSGASVLSRFDAVEGLSGSSKADYLAGDDADATAIAGAGARGSVLTNIGLIDGLQEFLNDLTPGPAPVTFFDAGNIILGGDGSDIIEGRGGNDLIDGDAWLNVRIGVYAASDVNHTGDPITSFDSMEPMISHMLSGEWNPAQLGIIREINYADGPDFDTAKFSAALVNLGADGLIGGGDDVAQYAIAINGIDVGDLADPLVRATAFDGLAPDDVITVTDLVGTDGIDTLRHIERLQFTDQSLVLGGLNHEPVGSLTITGIFEEDQLLTVSTAGVTDADNANGGVIPPPIAYFWQVETAPGSGVFTDILSDFTAGEVARTYGPTFTPTDAEANLAIRVRGVYKDALGVLEEVYSDPQVVANVNDAPVGTVLISDTSPTETLTIQATNAFTDADGLTGAVFTYQWEQSAVGGGAVFTAITGATAASFTPTQAQVNRQLRVVVTYTDDHGTTETVTSAATTVVGDFIPANAASQTLTGNAGDDLILGGAGNDTLNGLGGGDTLDGGAGTDTLNGGDGNDSLSGGAAVDNLNGGTGNDTLVGGAGNDVINAGADNDTINYTIGDGNDAVNGGIGTDTLNVSGTVGSDTLNVLFNGTLLTGVGTGTLADVEIFNADLGDGSDTLSYGNATTAGVTVNLAAHSASGFGTITGIENVTGGSGGDSLTGDALGNALNGNGGNDTLNGGLGEDTLTGAGGTDTASYAGESNAMFINLATGSARRGSAGAPVEDTLVTIENVIGGDGNDSITGGTGANRLEGGFGNDTLVGGTGNDTLIGGDGNDTFTYAFGDGADSVDGGAGIDTLNIIGTAAANTLDVIWNGTSLTSFEGGTLTSVDSVVNLGGGTDTLTYAGSASGVIVNLATAAASGFSSVTGVENVTGGDGNDTLTGTNLANSLSGGVGNDTLDGNGGTDLLVGGAGNDTYITDGGDTLTEGNNAGIDTVVSSVTFTLANNFENLTLSGAGNINATGNGANNVIIGNAGDNIITGGTGADIMDGGAGNDTFDFNALNESSGANVDTINGFQGPGVLGGDVIDLSTIDAINGGADQAFNFIGSAAFSAAGQLRAQIDVINNVTIIQGNTNANTGTVEFELRLSGQHSLFTGDFIL